MRRVLPAVVATIAVGLVVVPGALARSAQTRYARAVPLCPLVPKPHHVTCFAMRLVRVSRTAKAAVAYKVAAGATADGTIGPAGGLTPIDLASAYGYTTQFSTSSTAGTGQLVAIIDWGNDKTIASDLNGFDSNYGLKTCTTANGCLTVRNQAGTVINPATASSPTDQGAAGEISLDVEAVHSVCQNCKIVLIEVNSASNASVEAGANKAAALHATEISNSYGGPDSGGQTGQSDVAAYNHPGIVITASTGDDGYYGFDTWVKSTPTNPSAPNDPAEYPTVVAVGGTSLFLNQSGTRSYETVWNENGVQGSIEQRLKTPMGAEGGGCSLTWLAEPWQSHLAAWPQAGCGTGSNATRLAADVSAVGDPFTGFDTFNHTDCGSRCGWQTIGGTSLSAPVVAALFALAGGSHGVAYPALTLYGHLGSSALYDVTAGGNGVCDGEGAAQCGNVNNLGLGTLDCDYNAAGTAVNAGDLACDAAPGYDGPTGVGTPNGLGAFALTGPTANISGPTTNIVPGVQNTWSAASVHDPFPGGSVSSYTWNWGDGSPHSTGASASHTYSTTGTKTITLTLKDNYSMTGTKTLLVTVG